MYDYLLVKTPDYGGIFDIAPQVVLTEKVSKSQAVHEYDSGNVDVVSFSDDPIFLVTLQWEALSEADAGTIFALYTDSGKANAQENTFYWKHIDGHTYVVRFAGPLSRSYKVNTHPSGWRSIDQITLRVEGKKANS